MLLKSEKSALLIIDVQEKLSPLVIQHQKMIQNCQSLSALAKRLNVPMLVSEQYPSGLGHTVEPIRQYFDKEQCLSKVHFSCMKDSDCEKAVSQLEKTQVVLAGIEAHVCVLQTALDMRDAGYEVFVVVDAISSRKESDYKIALKRMQQIGVHLVSYEMVFFEWLKQAATAEFKALSKEFIQ